MMLANPYEQYRQQGVMTASPVELIVMLYDGCIKQMKLGVMAIENKDYSAANQALQKAQDILGELVTSLDMNYELAATLLELYNFFLSELVEANMSKNTQRIAPVIEIMQDLRVTWAEAAKMNRVASISVGE